MSRGVGHSGKMAERGKEACRGIPRLYFRRARIALWMALLALLGFLIYLNQAGLPDFLKRPVLARLQERGLDLQFSRLRLGWAGGIVAENVRFGGSREAGGPQLAASNVLVNLDRRSLLRLRLNVESLTLNKGRFSWPLKDASGGPPRTLAVSNIQTSLRLLPGDSWALDTFAAQFQGASLEVAGRIDNASALNRWTRPEPGAKPEGRARLEDRLNEMMTTFDRIHFGSPPALRLEVRGDALAPASLRVRFLVSAPDAETPWGRFLNGRFSARSYPSLTNAAPLVRIRLDAGRAETPWAAATDLRFRLDGSWHEWLTNFMHLSLRAAAASAETKWAGATNILLLANLAALDPEGRRITAVFNVDAASASTRWANAADIHCEGTATGARTNPIPESAVVKIQAASASTQWADAAELSVECSGSRIANSDVVSADAAWMVWTNFVPYQFDWRVRAAEARTPESKASGLAVEGSWRSPKLELARVQAAFPDGPFDFNASLDVASRLARAKAHVNFDPLQVRSLLPRAAVRWLSQFTWDAPPEAAGDMEVTLPEWSTPMTNWGPALLPSLRLAGQFNVATNGSYRGIAATGARSHFSYTNRCWLLPDLEVSRPEGRLKATHFANEVTKQQYWKIQSTLDPVEIAPRIEKQSKPVMDLLSFTRPPVIEAEIWEWSRQPDRLGIKAMLHFDEFGFRGDKFTRLDTALEYTNKTLLAIEPRIEIGTRRITAESFLADFNRDLGFLTNGTSDADPMVIARAIGEEVVAALEPYHFAAPPALSAAGIIPFKGEEGADLRVSVNGSQFRWLSFDIPRISGNIHWLGTNLLLSNMEFELYEGDATGFAEFHFVPKAPTIYKFAITTTNTHLKPLMREALTSTNNIEGSLSGSLVVTHGSTDDWRTWDGYGSLRLRDGLIWDIPVFGILSPMLNTIAPGLGNSRANSGSLSFNMTNGVVHSSDLEMQASAMRLRYRGHVDLHTRVNARVEAELLRDLGVIGPLVSAVFWPVTKMFEFRITGTLGDPKLEPVYMVPKLMLLPFQSFRFLKGLTRGDWRDNGQEGPVWTP